MTDHNALVCPSYCIEYRDVSDLLREFGPYEGRYVYQYPNDWRLRLLEHIEQLSPAEKLKTKTLITEKLEPVLLPVRATYREDASWAANVREQQRFKNTCAVGDAIEPDGYKTWEESLDEIRDSRVRAWNIGGALEDYLSLFEPLFIKAPACYLIDRFFDPVDDKSMDFLSKILDRLVRTSCFKLHMITRYEAINDQLRLYAPEQKYLEKKRIRECLLSRYSGMIPQGRILEIHLVEEGKEGGEFLRMHNRYFLTKYGALDLGIGYKLISQRYKQMDVYVVDKQNHENLKAKFIDGVTRFDDQNLPKRKSIPYPKDVDTVVIKGT